MLCSQQRGSNGKLRINRQGSPDSGRTVHRTGSPVPRNSCQYSFRSIWKVFGTKQHPATKSFSDHLQRIEVGKISQREPPYSKRDSGATVWPQFDCYICLRGRAATSGVVALFASFSHNQFQFLPQPSRHPEGNLQAIWRSGAVPSP